MEEGKENVALVRVAGRECLQHPENKHFTPDNPLIKTLQSDSKPTANRQQIDIKVTAIY